MALFNTVAATLTCPACGMPSAILVQFKFGHTRQLRYELGDAVAWGGNDVGEAGKKRVVVDGVVEERCPVCRSGAEWNVYVHIENDRIVGVENATGEFDFFRTGRTYIVLE